MAKVLSKLNFYIGTGVAPTTPPGSDTFNEVGNVTALSGPTISKDQVETTDMDSVVKEYLGDLADTGELSFTCNRNYGNTGQTAIRTDALGATQRNFRIEKLDPADDSVLETYNFYGEVLEWSEDHTQGSVATVSGRVKLASTITVS